MTDAKRAKRPTFTTPVGIARFPHLNAPDTRFNAAGDYKADLRIKTEDATQFIAYLEEIRDKFVADYVAPKKATVKIADVYGVEFDDEGEETGYVIIKTKLNATGENKKTGETWTNEPKLFDADGNPIPKSVKVWSGSKLIVAGTVNTYAFTKDKNKKTGAVDVELGVTLKCRGVQVLELVSGAGQTADSFGFKKQDGYKAPAAAAGIGDTDAGDTDDAPAGTTADAGDGEF